MTVSKENRSGLAFQRSDDKLKERLDESHEPSDHQNLLPAQNSQFITSLIAAPNSPNM